MKAFLWIAVVICLIGATVFKADQDSAKAAAQKLQDSQAQELQVLKAKVAALENTPRPQEHHYELRSEGSRSFRFDPATGQSCIQLASVADWKRPETIRQGCQYQDWANAPGATPKDYYSAECMLVHDVGACDTLKTLNK